MSRKKRPSTIKQTLESVLIPLHIGTIADQPAKIPPGVYEPTRLLTGDLTYT